MGFEDDFAGFPLYKGLQKPLEFMGIRGRFLRWAAASAGGSFLAFVLFAAAFGLVTGFIAAAAAAGGGLASIYVRQARGLHDKKRSKGVRVYRGLFKRRVRP